MVFFGGNSKGNERTGTGRNRMKGENARKRMLCLALGTAVALAAFGCTPAGAGAVGTAEPPAAASGVPPATTISGLVSEASRSVLSKQLALEYLAGKLSEGTEYLYVYSDFADSGNRFTQKAKIDDGRSWLIEDMDENWGADPYAGNSCIRCRASTEGRSWGGWLFVNGRLPEDSPQPILSFGESALCGYDLSGAASLSFWAKGENGGERVEFFTAGLGRNGETGAVIANYPDSTAKVGLGFVTLTDEWTKYTIGLDGRDLSYVGCGFGFVVSGSYSGGTQTFYLDEIRFEGRPACLKDALCLLASFETDTCVNEDDIYIRNAAFSYDYALTAMAFMSAGMQSEARRILDAFVYAVQNDRYAPGRVRNAYAAGDITAFPGWESGARLPGWFDVESGSYVEDRYQVGSNVGNSSYVALMFLHGYLLYGDGVYLETARSLMDWVFDNCSDGGAGFTAGCDGWPENGPVYTFTYKSIEHNIDAYAAFGQLYAVTGEKKYKVASESALAFIRSMYDGGKGCFYTGTADDGVTASTGNIVLDAQVWSALALGEEFVPYLDALDFAMNMQTSEGGYPFHEENSGGGFWPEGTSFTALALDSQGYREEARDALRAVRSTQLSTGAFPAATVDGLTTGFELFTGEAWCYGKNPHIAPTAWYVLAVNGFNPYDF